MHINNSANLKELDSLKYMFVSIIIIFSQFLLGLFLALTRIRLGIKFAILQQTLFNLPAAILVILRLFSENIANAAGIIISVGFFAIILILSLVFIFSNQFCKYQKAESSEIAQ